jgi:uncharacterized protein (TIGR00369 family)
MASAAEWQERGKGRLPGLLGIEVVEVGEVTTLRVEIRPHHLAPNGFLHAGTVISLADTACGYGCMESLPAGANGFTTVETKSNHIGTIREGAAVGRGPRLHRGRTTMAVRSEAGTFWATLNRIVAVAQARAPAHGAGSAGT